MPLPFPVIDALFDPAPRNVWTSSSPAPDGPPPEPPPRRCFAQPEELAVCMKNAGVRQALVTQCRVWNCERQPLCAEQRADDVLKFVRAAPQRFVGVAGFNPFDIAAALREMEELADTGGFRGVYSNAQTYAISAADRRLYPLYAKAGELGWPVVVQCSAPVALLEVPQLANDFPELPMVAALRSWPERGLMERLAEQAENVFFLAPARMVGADLLKILSTPAGERLIWATDGIAWKRATDQLATLGIAPSLLRRYAFENAEQVFHLSEKISVKAAVAGETMAAER